MIIIITINHPVGKHTHITRGANALTLQSMVTFDIIKQFRQRWQVSTNQGNLISVAFQSKLIFFLLAVLVIEQIYTSVMGFY